MRTIVAAAEHLAMVVTRRMKKDAFTKIYQLLLIWLQQFSPDRFRIVSQLDLVPNRTNSPIKLDFMLLS
jgi:hypothetical protein